MGEHMSPKGQEFADKHAQETLQLGLHKEPAVLHDSFLPIKNIQVILNQMSGAGDQQLSSA